MLRPATLAGLTVLTLLAGTLTACEPTCRNTCSKLLSCETESDRVTIDECEAACVFQQREYEDLEQDRLRDRFAEHKRCIGRETCDDLTAGVCYDEELAPF